MRKILTCAFICFTFFSAYKAYLKPQGKAQVLIRGQSSVWTFPIDANETVFVPGPLGQTTVLIGEGKAWVENSPCDNLTCVAAGFITKQGQWAACLPNQVLLMIQGSSFFTDSGGQQNGGHNVDAVVW